MPHQAIVLMTVAGLSLLLTGSIMIGLFSREKRQQASNTNEH